MFVQQRGRSAAPAIYRSRAAMVARAPARTPVLRRPAQPGPDPLGRTLARAVAQRAATAQQWDQSNPELVDMDQFPKCDETIGWAPRPDLDEWFSGRTGDVLDTVRNGSRMMSRHAMAPGANNGALRLVKQAILAFGCEHSNLNLLPMAGDTGPFGPETEIGVEAVQELSGLYPDGVIGRRTMNVLDRFVAG